MSEDEKSDQELIDQNLCPNCEVELERQGGCARCPQCGFSLCG